MTNYYSHQMENIQSMYSDACIWFDSLGFSYAKTRYGIYKKIFSEFLRRCDERDFSGDIEEFKKKFDNAYLEVHEAIRIYHGLKSHETTEFLAQLKKVLSGQEFRAQSEDDKARDFLFELSVATRFINAGYKVDLKGDCDVVVELDDQQTLFVECKRVTSQKKLEKNIKKANTQLKNRLRKTGKPNAIGLVAIDITDLLPKIEKLPVNSNSEATNIHRAVSHNYLMKNIHSIISSKIDSCLGVMCTSSMMNYFSIESQLHGFQYSRHTDHIPYNYSQKYEALSQKLSNQDIM
ncbi:hypothetical protein [Aeromonas salmonicida]|uniref:hypothetical protein n=1 Tax=Aeromonas salmonicida TaxID=645 RepID=UPI00240D2852|nr:hypothetical protein [Aeromonas salmonicida]WFC14822.1 hypothetical protein L3V47_03445 [Aeromonas salmonicida]HEH9408843.1 hypothetical protein [Aeromonas salmonicida]